MREVNKNDGFSFLVITGKQVRRRLERLSDRECEREGEREKGQSRKGRSRMGCVVIEQ